MTNTDDAATTLARFLDTYAIAGSDFMHRGVRAYRALPEIVALSLASHRGGVTRYRVATLADGSLALAERKGRGSYRIALTAARAAHYPAFAA